MTGSTAGSDFSSGWDGGRSDVDSEIEYGLEPNVDDASREEARLHDEASKGTKRQVGGAAVAAGIAGTLIVGPVVGLVAAGGAAVVAAKTKGSAGNVARASGDVVANAGDRIRKFDQKHQVTSKASKGFVKGAKWVSNKLKVKDRNGNAADSLTT